jgi:hypothetical protein
MALNEQLTARLSQSVENHLPAVLQVYRHLNRHPELSGQEANTAVLAAQTSRSSRGTGSLCPRLNGRPCRWK